MMTILRMVLALAILALAGCQTSQVVMNQPLPKDAAHAPIYTPGYTLMGMLKGPRDDQVLLALAFSGGGKRSAAFAYGTLLGLRSMTVVEDSRSHPLLDDVDYIAAVSGGSFPAMHYGLYREKSFETFEHDFLKRDVNAYIFGIYLLPWNWEWLINPLFGTNDAMAAVYDRLLFHGATYADLIRRGLPMISVDATDIAGGVPFPFNQASFDLLCSDLPSFPVSRAVAASAGLPILFTPITLTSYRSNCTAYPPPGAPPPDWREHAATLSRQTVLARNADRQMDPERTKFLHLLDGGISDNLALRSLSNALVLLDDNDETLRRLATATRRVIVISVDGQAAIDPALGQRRVVSGFGRIISAVSGSQIDAYSFETLLLADQQIEQLTEKLRRIRCEQGAILNGHDCADVKGALIQISLAGIEDAAYRRRLQAIPTSLTVSDADVDLLVAEGKTMVQSDPTLLGLIANLDAEPSQSPTQAGCQASAAGRGALTPAATPRTPRRSCYSRQAKG
jgi:NTE family protein